MAENEISETTFDVVVIGGGPAGVETAAEAGKSKLKTLIVADMPIGGRATYGSLLPSKAWLHTAEEHAHGNGRGGGMPDLTPLREAIQRHQKGRTAQLSQSLAEQGVTVVSGTGRFINRNTVRIYPTGESATDVSAKAIVITSGSEPRFFPNVKPDGNRMIAPRHTQKLQELPGNMIMVGGGVTGCEYALAFQKMGTQVHLITDIDRLLPRTEPDLAAALRRRMETLGVEFSFNSPIKSVEAAGNEVLTTTQDGSEYRSDYTFIATGRRPDDSFLEEAAERPAQTDGGWLQVDARGRSSLKGVYAAGDIAGPPLTANNAHALARRIVADIRGEEQSSRIPPLIEAVYTDPQAVHIGPVLDLAGGSTPGVKEIRHNYADTLLGRIHEDEDAFVKIWVNEADDLIRGAAAFGESAVDILAPVQMAMEHGISFTGFRSTPFAHPALSEVLTL